MAHFAIVFVPHGADLTVHIAACLAYCAARGYEVFGTVRGDVAAVVSALLAGHAELVVVARAEHRPAPWMRVEVAAEGGDRSRNTGRHDQPVPPRARRPRRV